MTRAGLTRVKPRRRSRVYSQIQMPFSRTRKTRSHDLERPWLPGDSIPAPEAIHEDGDSGWALWNEISRQHERRFARTAPMTRPLAASPAPRAPQAQALFTLEAAMLVARRNNRVCPRPQRWDAFMVLLPPRKTLRGSAQPPAPPTGAAWAMTPSLTKRLCFREHIEWAERAGLLEEVMAFMQSMAEEDWLHMGED